MSGEDLEKTAGGEEQKPEDFVAPKTGSQEPPLSDEPVLQETVDELAGERKSYVFTQRESVRIHRALGVMAVEETNNLKRFKEEGNDPAEIEGQQKYIDELYALQDKVERSGQR